MYRIITHNKFEITLQIQIVAYFKVPENVIGNLRKSMKMSVLLNDLQVD